MTLDEAIKEFTDWAKGNRKEQNFWAAERDENDETNPLSYADCEGLARDAETRAEYHEQLAEWLTDYKELKNSIGAVKLSNMKEALELIREYKAENVMLRELNDKIYDVLAKQFGSPCNCSYAVDEYMRKNGSCDDCGVEIPDKECWSRYIQTKLIGGAENG